MVDRRDIVRLINHRVTVILDAAEAAFLAEHQFKAFRRLVLREFGEECLQSELKALLQRPGRNAAGLVGNRTGRNDLGTKGGAP